MQVSHSEDHLLPPEIILIEEERTQFGTEVHLLNVPEESGEQRRNTAMENNKVTDTSLMLCLIKYFITMLNLRLYMSGSWADKSCRFLTNQL